MYSIVIYVIVSVILIYAVYKLLMCLRRYCNIISCTKIEGGTLGKMLPPLDSSGRGNNMNKSMNTSNESLTISPDTPQSMNEGAKRALRLCTPKSY